MTEVVALFATRTDAERAIESLERMGHDASSVGYVKRHHDDVEMDHTVETVEHDEPSEGVKGAAGGAMGGAAVGAGTGLLASAGMLLIPGIGPFLAAGTLASTLGAAAAGAAGGAVIGGAAGAIFGDDNDHERSMYYREGVEEGGSLVTVAVHDGDTVSVTSMLRDMGAKKVDVHDDTGWID
jgi:hypothetical protein